MMIVSHSYPLPLTAANNYAQAHHEFLDYYKQGLLC